MKNTPSNLLKIAAVCAVIVYIVYRAREGYTAGRADYRYGFVDTNPSRRVADAFDSPNIDNPYEGLPLP
tara:strand:+ start:1180 stop:1386 length:207 start_codon:yes stop_codon:yes gene_type:complete